MLAPTAPQKYRRESVIVFSVVMFAQERSGDQCQKTFAGVGHYVLHANGIRHFLPAHCYVDTDFVCLDRIDAMMNAFATNRVEAATMLHCSAIRVFVLTFLLGPVSFVFAQDADSAFTITTKRAGDQVKVEVETEKTCFVVRSSTGIGRAIIERNGTNWPKTVLVRLHLKGLENFRVSNGQDCLVAAVSHQDGRASLWMDGEETSLLDSQHPYWMKIRVVENEESPGQPNPSKDGWFQMQLPKALLEDDPKSIELKWIDFYR